MVARTAGGLLCRISQLLPQLRHGRRPGRQCASGGHPTCRRHRRALGQKPAAPAASPGCAHQAQHTSYRRFPCLAQPVEGPGAGAHAEHSKGWVELIKATLFKHAEEWEHTVSRRHWEGDQQRFSAKCTWAVELRSTDGFGRCKLLKGWVANSGGQLRVGTPRAQNGLEECMESVL